MLLLLLMMHLLWVRLHASPRVPSLLARLALCLKTRLVAWMGRFDRRVLVLDVIVFV